MFTLSSSDRNKYLAFDENILKVEDKLNHMAASIFLDVDDCRQLASALLHGAESQILRQAINDWIFESDSVVRQLPVDTLMMLYRGDLVDTNIDASAFIKEIDARLRKVEAGSANPAA